MKAVISDIHANWEALQAVLQDAAAHRAEQIYCLGDLVGYGPDPCHCVDLLRELQVTTVVRGNHDDAVFGQADGFNQGAARALRWTKDQLLASPDSHRDAILRKAFLENLPLRHAEPDLLFMHGSPRDPLNEYVFPQHIYNLAKMQTLFRLVPRYCFLGHTHIPGIFTEGGRFLAPEEVDSKYQLGPGKAIVNVGSVGLSRDGDPRACYVLLDGCTVVFRRVGYDIDRTRMKVARVAALDASQWD